MLGDIEKELRNWFADAKKVVVAGIGNPLRSDDYVGLKIVENMQGKVRSGVCLLECEVVPESYLLDIEKFNPSHVLIVDAAVLGRNAGEAILVDAQKVAGFSAVSSHVLPIRIFCEYVKKTTGAKIALLLIEPKGTDFGEGLSVEGQAAAEQLTRILLTLLG
jgi:hydrogenase 3 maturation protease